MAASKIPPDSIVKNIAALSRHPFREQVALMLGCAPSHDAIVNLAERSPDRYWQAVAIAARLAGYTDKLELDATVQANISGMSDAELRQAIESIAVSPPCYREVDAAPAKE